MRKQTPEVVSPAKIRRCAIYTRKSSEEGLDQAFNSLDAQREAGEAYIKSQAHEGWLALLTRYDDGGYSGGSMDRPGLKRLLDDINQNRIDIIVVYKVDRLTRSLADFAKIVEILDRQTVSFVSITQAFNTTSSMGRLTLNVLLSFAQFEREVTGERIRDKIAASKRKGMWMGGNPPLGYDVKDRKLVLNQPEAERVRAIYETYLKLRTVNALSRDLIERSVHSKRWKTQDGKDRGGSRFTRGSLYHLLKSRVYLGEVVHRDKVYAGDHPPIIAKALWDKVQVQLSANLRAQDAKLRSASGAPLRGLLYDDQGNAMSPSFARKRNGTRYHYYVSQALLQHRPEAAGSLPRIAAPSIESFITEQVLAGLTERSRKLLEKLAAGDRADQLRALLRRVEVAIDRVTIVFAQPVETPQPHLELNRDIRTGATKGTDSFSITVPTRLRSWGGKTIIEAPNSPAAGPPRFDRALMKSLAQAHQWKELLIRGTVGSLEDIARQSGCSAQYVRQILNLAFLAPGSWKQS